MKFIVNKNVHYLVFSLAKKEKNRDTNFQNGQGMPILKITVLIFLDSNVNNRKYAITPIVKWAK